MPKFVSAGRTAALGLLAAAIAAASYYFGSGIDGLGLGASLSRIVHVVAAVLWVGMIWFVNFVQLAALAEVDDAGRGVLMRHVVPRVATIFRHASHLTLVSGAVLLVTSGYLFERWVYKSAVYIPPLKITLMLAAIGGAIVMWGLVHFVIWPALRTLMDSKVGDVALKAQMRERARLAARINLLLALPVTVIMVVVSHG